MHSTHKVDMEQSQETGNNDIRERDLPAHGWPRLQVLLARAIRRQCPECGGGDIFSGWLTIKDACPHCGYVFAREGGYFLGAYALNLIVAEFIPVALMIGLLIWSDLDWVVLELILIPLAVLLPFVFFPFARTFWMALDEFFTPVNQR
jgi:uncharacterized protein (DUF983 family)